MVEKLVSHQRKKKTAEVEIRGWGYRFCSEVLVIRRMCTLASGSLFVLMSGIRGEPLLVILIL